MRKLEYRDFLLRRLHQPVLAHTVQRKPRDALFELPRVRERRRYFEHHVGWAPHAIADDRFAAVYDEGDIRLQDDAFAPIEHDLDAHPEPPERLGRDIRIERGMQT